MWFEKEPWITGIYVSLLNIKLTAIGIPKLGNITMIVKYMVSSKHRYLDPQWKDQLCMDVIKNENKLCYMMGGYNIIILNYDFHAPSGEFVDTVSSYAFVLLVTRTTRVTATSATSTIFSLTILKISKIISRVSWWLVYLTIIPFSILILLIR